MVAATDGVGTKLKIAIENRPARRHRDGSGGDVRQRSRGAGAQNRCSFLDYFACGKTRFGGPPAVIIAGVAEGCREAGCALIGGENRRNARSLQGWRLRPSQALAVGRRRTRHAVCRDPILPLATPVIGLCLIRRSLQRILAGPQDRRNRGPWFRSNRRRFSPPTGYDAGWRACWVADAALCQIMPCVRSHETGAVKGLAHITGGRLHRQLFPRCACQKHLGGRHRPCPCSGACRCSNGWQSRGASANSNCCAPSTAASA